MISTRTIFAAAGLAALLSGCDQGPSNDSHATAAASTMPAAMIPAQSQGHATIHGTVVFQGVPPTMTAIPSAMCMDNHAPIFDESVVVSKTSGLKNAVVYLENAPSSPAPSKPAILDQVNCRYEPHVLAMQTNQPLTIHSSDATFHNVHYSPEINPPSNFAMVKAGQESSVTFKSAEIIKFSCDVHPWMSAWVAVFDHPYFSVTPDAGSYEIKSVPAGAYTLICWHERLGRQQLSLTIADNQSAQADFVYKAPQ